MYTELAIRQKIPTPAIVVNSAGTLFNLRSKINPTNKNPFLLHCSGRIVFNRAFHMGAMIMDNRQLSIWITIKI